MNILDIIHFMQSLNSSEREFLSHLGKLLGADFTDLNKNTFLSEKVPHIEYQWKDNLKENVFHLNLLSYGVTVDVT